MTVYPSDLDKAILYYNTQLRQFEECKKIKAVTPEDYEWAEKYRQFAEWLEELRELRKQKRLPSAQSEPCNDGKGCPNCMYSGRPTYKSPCSECRDKSQWEMKPISRSHENGADFV